MNNNTLIKYLRTKNGEPRGVAVAVRKGDEVFYGYSLRNPVDRWNKHKGLEIATHRAFARVYNLPQASNTISEIIESYKHLSDRAVKYFKDLPKDNVEFEPELNPFTNQFNEN